MPTTLYVAEQGTGAPVLLLAGLGDQHTAWGFQLETLSAERRLLAPDNPGIGRSGLPADGISVAGMAEDAAAVLRDRADGPAHVMGFSGGGAVAQELALREPELVRSLVLVGTWCAPDEHWRALTATWSALLEHAPPEVFFAVLLRWVYSDAAHEDGRVAGWLTEALDDPFGPGPGTLAAQIDALAAHDTARRLHDLRMPVLVVAGDADAIFPAPVAFELASRIPGAQLALMPGLGHQPFHEDPEGFDAIVTAFWDEVEAA